MDKFWVIIFHFMLKKKKKKRTNSENLSSKWIGVKLEAWKWDADETLGALLF